MDKVKPTKVMDTNPFKATALSLGGGESSKSMNIDDKKKKSFQNKSPNLRMKIKSKHMEANQQTLDGDVSDSDSMITHAGECFIYNPKQNKELNEQQIDSNFSNNPPELKTKIRAKPLKTNPQSMESGIIAETNVTENTFEKRFMNNKSGPSVLDSLKPYFDENLVGRYKETKDIKILEKQLLEIKEFFEKKIANWRERKVQLLEFDKDHPTISRIDTRIKKYEKLAKHWSEEIKSLIIKVTKEELLRNKQKDIFYDGLITTEQLNEIFGEEMSKQMELKFKLVLRKAFQTEIRSKFQIINPKLYMKIMCNPLNNNDFNSNNAHNSGSNAYHTPQQDLYSRFVSQFKDTKDVNLLFKRIDKIEKLFSMKTSRTVLLCE